MQGDKSAFRLSEQIECLRTVAMRVRHSAANTKKTRAIKRCGLYNKRLNLGEQLGCVMWSAKGVEQPCLVDANARSLNRIVSLHKRLGQRDEILLQTWSGKLRQVRRQQRISAAQQRMRCA